MERPAVTSASWFDQANHLLRDFPALPARERWQVPFPFGVFGTLRRGHRNHFLMERAPVLAHRLAFLPHFVAQGLHLLQRTGVAAPFEVFAYEPQAWREVLKPVEVLEEFTPGVWQEEGYQRTLAWLSLLPEGERPEAFATGLAGERRLALPFVWTTYPRVPCWIYSSVAQNRRAVILEDSPLLWDGVVAT